MAKKLDFFVIRYLDDMLIYTRDASSYYVQAFCWVFDEIRKNVLFAKFKKCRYHKDKLYFLSYVVLVKRV